MKTSEDKFLSRRLNKILETRFENNQVGIIYFLPIIWIFKIFDYF